MDDKELLKLAAKAAGIEIQGWSEIHNAFFIPAAYLARNTWNPLTDDGDEARLETALILNVSWYDAGVLVGTEISTPDSPACFEYFDKHDDDKQSARRLAGVRAAAEIGKQ